MTLPGILVGKLKKIPTSAWVIDPWPESLFSFLEIKNSFFKRLITQVSHWHYRQIDKFVVLSERARTNMLKVTKLPKSKVIVLPMACEKVYEEQVHNAKLAKKFSQGFNIFFAGTITPILSFDTWLGAASILKDKGYNDINWVIVGDGMARKDLENDVRKRGLAKNFFFEGFKQVAEIPAYTTDVADVLFSCLTKNEFLELTIPAKVNSYLAAGKPIVLSMNGAAFELINDVVHCGYASPAEDAKALAKNIEKLYKMTAAQREKLGKKARDFHFKYFERDIVLKTLLAYIKR